MTWISVFARLVAFPIAVAIGDYLFPGVDFAAPSQWIAVGVVLAVISIAVDTLFPKRFGILGCALVYAVVVAGIVRLIPDLMPHVKTTRLGSIELGVLLGVAEVVTHLIPSGARKKVPPRWTPPDSKAGT